MATWTIDGLHSMAEFQVKHMMVSTVRGTFDDISGTLEFDETAPENSRVEAVVKTASVNTRVADRDNHLRSGDFFDVETYPEMRFVSTSVEVTGDKVGKITGELTIRDVTKTVAFDVEYFGETAPSPFGDRRVGFSGSLTIDREDWGLTWNQALETGGWLVSKDVKLNIELQAMTELEPTPSA